MKFHKIFAAGAMLAAMVLAGCSDDHIDGPDINAPEGDFYTTLKIEMPAGSRSTTEEWNGNTNSSSGYEEGQDWENSVNNVLVILTNQNGDYITHGYVINPEASTGTTNPTYTIRFNLGSFDKLGQDPSTPQENGTQVRIFAFCNPNAEMVAQFPDAESQPTVTSFADNIVNPEVGTNIRYLIPWGSKENGGFLMSNHEIALSNKVPGVNILAKHNVPSNPFDLGQVKVERTSVRFDFKPKYSGEGSTTLASYTIYKTPGIEGSGIQGYVTLTDMTLMNQANQYYWLRHVSADGTNTNWVLCGTESPLGANGTISPNTTPFVVSPNWSLKQSPNFNKNYDAVKPYYTYSYYVADNRDAENPTFALDFNSIENWTAISSFGSTIKDEDDDNNWHLPGTTVDGETTYPSNAGYYIWRYTTENTIPALTATDLVSSQRHAITTGVIFKGNITAEPGSALATSMGTGATKNILYAFNGTIYGNKADIIAEAKKNYDSSLADKVISLFGFRNDTNQNQSNQEILEAVTTEQIAAINETNLTTTFGGLTIYRPDSDGNYPVYYPYYNRHNDNGNPGIMGVMEFATVRNNVYKLAVDNILQFGHPGNPGDDPDPDEPDNPDESAKVYFKLNVVVLPWVVRVNNIIL